MNHVRLSALLGLAVLSGASAAVAQDLLPIRPGTYVRDGWSCEDPPFAAMIEYDGRALTDPHSRACTSTVVSHAGTSYEVSTTCRALGDGTPTPAFSGIDRIVVASPNDFVDVPGQDAVDYRRCTAD